MKSLAICAQDTGFTALLRGGALARKIVHSVQQDGPEGLEPCQGGALYPCGAGTALSSSGVCPGLRGSKLVQQERPKAEQGTSHPLDFGFG